MVSKSHVNYTEITISTIQFHHVYPSYPGHRNIQLNTCTCTCMRLSRGTIHSDYIYQYILSAHLNHSHSPINHLYMYAIDSVIFVFVSWGRTPSWPWYKCSISDMSNMSSLLFIWSSGVLRFVVIVRYVFVPNRSTPEFVSCIITETCVFGLLVPVVYNLKCKISKSRGDDKLTDC